MADINCLDTMKKALCIQKPLPALEGMPAEMMSMIVFSMQSKEMVKENESEDEASKATHQGYEKCLEPILDAIDVGNLRLVNRRIQGLVQDDFGRRFFTTRKHMISPLSLRALFDISCHPILASYVHEVAIGPERLNSNSGLLIASCNLPNNLLWYSMYRQTHEQLVYEQKQFEDSGNALATLSKALKNLCNLEKVRLDTYAERRDADEWTSAWGTKSLLRQIGLIEGCAEARPSISYALLDQGNHVSNVHWHCNYVLEALYQLKDRKNWVLDYSLNTLEIYYDTEPFDLSSPEWQACKNRVESVSLKRALAVDGSDIIDCEWISQLLHECQNLKFLNFEKEFYWAKACFESHWPKLRQLILTHCHAQDSWFRDFLVGHSDSLDTIICKKLKLTAFEDLCGYQILSDYYEHQDPSWTEKFEIMLGMSRLKRILLADLSWVHGLNSDSNPSNPVLANFEEDLNTRLQQGGCDRVDVEGARVQLVLKRAVEDRATVEKDGTVKVWFFET